MDVQVHRRSTISVDGHICEMWCFRFCVNENCIRPTQLILTLCVRNLHLSIVTISERFIWLTVSECVSVRECAYAISLSPYQLQNFIYSTPRPPSPTPSLSLSHSIAIFPISEYVHMKMPVCSCVFGVCTQNFDLLFAAVSVHTQ